jgi:hypothetical protein
MPISGKRKCAQSQNPNIKPQPTPAPSNAPKIPRTRLNSPATGGFGFLLATAGRNPEIGGGASGGGAVAAVACGGGRLMRNPPAAGAMGGGGAETTGGAAASWAAISALAAAVPSALQAGQLTANGIRPFTGSTSNLNF